MRDGCKLQVTCVAATWCQPVGGNKHPLTPCSTLALHRFEKYVPSKWEETSSILLNDDACQQIKRDRAEVVKWLHHTEARRAQHLTFSQSVPSQ